MFHSWWILLIIAAVESNTERYRIFQFQIGKGRYLKVLLNDEGCWKTIANKSKFFSLWTIPLNPSALFLYLITCMSEFHLTHTPPNCGRDLWMVLCMQVKVKIEILMYWVALLFLLKFVLALPALKKWLATKKVHNVHMLTATYKEPHFVMSRLLITFPWCMCMCISENFQSKNIFL